MLCRQYIIVSIENSIEEVIQKLENISKTLFKWFSGDKMKVNLGKCYFLSAPNSKICITVGKKTKRHILGKTLGIFQNFCCIVE